jgi:hypothetical protein
MLRWARFEEDKTDQQVLHATNRKLACDGCSIDHDNDNDNDNDNDLRSLFDADNDVWSI